jgi:iron complex outermembrane recepter protein
MSRLERLDAFFCFRARPCGAKPSACAAASLALIASVQMGHVWAADPAASITTLPTVTVQTPASRDNQASITGWGNTPGWLAPAQAVKLQAEALEQAQVQRLADLVKLDASTSDAYNTTGYWDYLSIRGFTLDNASNYRREGLPISAETRIPLDNKSGVEIFKGTSGLQAGVSAPGGLINLLVKRPDGRLRQAEVAFTGGSSVKTAVDLSDRFGHEQQFGLRVNAAVERLDPDVQSSNGHRHVSAIAGQWQVSPDTQWDIEWEGSTYRQPSVPGLSAFGPSLPSADSINPSLNINQQAWTLPVEMRANTGSVRWQQNWQGGWKSVVSYGEQKLTSHDRAAFPFGCYDAINDIYYEDRYCPNGLADLYDYRSENETRHTRALQLQLNGQVATGQVLHDLTVGLLQSDFRKDVSTSPYNRSGQVDVLNPTAPLPAAPTPTDFSADLRERSTQLLLQDAVTINTHWRMWAGLRHTHYDRASTPTEGSPYALTHRVQDITTPWLALGYTVATGTQVYTSWGQGAEVFTAPRRSRSTNPGEVMAGSKSRQWEAGIKHEGSHQAWGVNLFDIKRPELALVEYTLTNTRRFELDGESTRQGLEAYWQWAQGPWRMNTSAMWLKAKRNGSSTGVNGLAPTNVPKHTLKWSGSYKLPAAWTGAWPTTTFMDIVHEGPRWADKANTLRVAAWTRVDANVQTVQKLSDQAITWRLGVTNLLNTRAWRESPNSFDHIWLFPMAARTWTASAQINF